MSQESHGNIPLSYLSRLKGSQARASRRRLEGKAPHKSAERQQKYKRCAKSSITPGQCKKNGDMQYPMSYYSLFVQYFPESALSQRDRPTTEVLPEA